MSSDGKLKKWMASNGLERVFKLKNFVEAIAFTNKIGVIAEEAGSPPVDHYRVGQGHCAVVDAQDQGIAQKRFHHGGEDG